MLRVIVVLLLIVGGAVLYIGWQILIAIGLIFLLVIFLAKISDIRGSRTSWLDWRQS
jgi:hypothetical protein